MIGANDIGSVCEPSVGVLRDGSEPSRSAGRDGSATRLEVGEPSSEPGRHTSAPPGPAERLARLEATLALHDHLQAERTDRVLENLGELRADLKALEVTVSGLSERHWKLVVALAGAGLLGSAAGGGVSELLKVILGL